MPGVEVVPPAPATTSDLAKCAEEPIHIPGAIQPHGVMVVLDPRTLTVQQASENAQRHFDITAADLLGRPVDILFPRELIETAIEAIDGRGSGVASTLQLRVRDRDYDGLLHHSGEWLVLELEPIAKPLDFASFYRSVQRLIGHLQAAPDLPAIYERAADAISELSGFERVMVYQFDEEWNGKVVAETLSATVDSYIGQQFPASDIPAQARELYRRNWLRIIPDASYKPVPILSLPSAAANPLDMSQSALRSVSPVHLEYLRNMGVAASMSVSVLRGDQLWGLIACHHSTPRTLPYHVRAACEMLGQIVSSAIAAREEKERLAAMLEAQRIQTQFFDHLAKEENVLDALAKYTPRLIELVGAQGAALCLHGRIVLVGTTPAESEAKAIVDWIKAGRHAEPIFATDSLSRVYPEATAFEKLASGLLAISLSREGHNFILWFRPEVPATIDWAGNPDKAALSDGMRIHPRLSFEIWQQRITGRSLPWREVDKQAAQELRNAINALILRRTDRLLRLNAELERKNVDLNSFAHIAAHDLQEPLRGLRETSAFLLEDYGKQLPDDGREKLESLVSLSQHMQDLIDALQQFSRVGRIEIKREAVSLDQLLQDARAAAGTKLEGVELRVDRALPVVQCDRVLVKEVLLNLLTNAVKYNKRDDRFIAVGTEKGENGEVNIYVRDNGIGIQEKHFHDIFRIFRRLHPQDRFGGGTGVGLAVCKAIIERHGGRIWVESVYGEGSTFHFTLP